MAWGDNDAPAFGERDVEAFAPAAFGEGDVPAFGNADAEAFAAPVAPAPQDLLAEAQSRGDLTAEGRVTPALLDAEGPGPFTRGFVTALRKGTPEMLGEAMEGGSRLMDADNPLRETVAAAGQDLKDVAASAPASYATRFNRFADIQSLGDAGSYLAEQAGSGVGSMVPGLVAGGLGAAAGKRVAGRGGAIVGGIAVGMASAAPLNYGELYQGLKEEGVDPNRAATIAVAGAVPLAALDFAGEAGVLLRLGGFAKRDVARGLAKRLAGEFGKGALAEGATEAIQQAAQESIKAWASGKPLWTAERGEAIVHAGIGGALGGGLVRGATGAIPDVPSAPDRPQQRAATQAPPPSDVQAPPPPPPAAATPPLADLMSDPRPLGDILADKERERIAAEAEAETRRQQAATDAMSQSGMPPVGSRVAVRAGSTAEPGQIIAAEVDQDGGRLSITVQGDNGDRYVVFGDDQDFSITPLDGDGTRAAPVKAAAPEHVDVAAAQAQTEPTPAQKEAGNYQKGHIKLHGLDITLENARGSQRSGTAPDGTPWSVEMPAHYGYVKRTEGADGDQVDVYIGGRPDSQAVYIVDQIDPDTGKFDEHKAVLSTASREEAAALYDAGFSDGRGPERRGAITEKSIVVFKDWLKNGNTRKPVAWRPAPKRPAEQASIPQPEVGATPVALPAETGPAAMVPAEPVVGAQTESFGGGDAEARFAPPAGPPATTQAAPGKASKRKLPAERRAEKAVRSAMERVGFGEERARPEGPSQPQEAGGAEAKATDDLDGFTEGMDAMRRGRVIATLSVMDYDQYGRKRSRGDLIREAIADGATLTRRGDKGAIIRTDGTFIDSRSLPKTSLDYAEHLLERRRVSEAAAPKRDHRREDESATSPPEAERQTSADQGGETLPPLPASPQRHPTPESDAPAPRPTRRDAIKRKAEVLADLDRLAAEAPTWREGARVARLSAKKANDPQGASKNPSPLMGEDGWG